MEVVVFEGGNISVNNTDADKPSPDPIFPTNTSCPISMEETLLEEIQMIILEDLMVHTIQHFKTDQR